MIYVVLVEPEGDKNIGFAARAMLNMGMEHLILVNPQCDYLSKDALDYSVHAERILEDAVVVPTLAEALTGKDLSVAMTRRIGQWRKRDFILPELGDFLVDYQDRNMAIVFGREKTGLETEEIFQCDLICSIPTSDEFPSLNLSHAVMVTLYQIFTAQNRPKLEKTPVSRKHFEAMLDSIVSSLDELGFFKNVPEWRLRNYLNKLLLRAKPDSADAKAIKNIFTRIRGMTIKWREGKEK